MADNSGIALDAVILIDWPLRVWHWLFALSVGASLYTGLSGKADLMDWHLRLGYCALGLLVFRAAWAIWGSPYARLPAYRFGAGSVLRFFRGQAGDLLAAHTPAGAALTVIMLSAVAVQALSGLASSDDILTEGPLVAHVSSDLVGLMTSVHHRAFWLVLGAIAVHLAAHTGYAVLRDPLPLAMITGRKRSALTPTQHHPLRAVVTALASVALIWAALAVL